jgi:hypothetical protein
MSSPTSQASPTSQLWQLDGAFSAAEVQHNPLTKVYFCQIIGYDWRLQAACAGYSPHGGGHPWHPLAANSDASALSQMV